MQTDDAIGVLCAHRWMTLDEQRTRLKADGCRIIINLGDRPREYLLDSVRQGTVVKVAFAFLLSKFGRGARRALADYEAFAKQLAKRPRGCAGYVKDLETGLVASSAGTQKAMLAVVKDQLARHGKGLRSAANGKRGGQRKTFGEADLLRAQLVWQDVKRYPTWPLAEQAMPKDFSRWRAHKLWGPRRQQK